MIRNLKIFWLALIAVFALGAMIVPGASAQNGEISAAGATNEFTLTGTETGVGTNRLTVFGSRIECPGSTYTGHKFNETSHKLIPDGASSITITPHYVNCTATALNLPATVTMNGCDYVFHLEGTTPGVDTYTILSTLVCPGKGPEVHIYKTGSEHIEPNRRCTLTIDPSAAGFKGRHATDTTNGHITITGSITGITVTQHAGPASGCIGAETTSTTGSIDADVTVKAHDKNLASVSIGISHK